MDGGMDGWMNGVRVRFKKANLQRDTRENKRMHYCAFGKIFQVVFPLALQSVSMETVKNMF